MSNANRDNVKIVLEWDRPAGNPLTGLAHDAIQQKIADTLAKLNMGYVSGQIKYNSPYRNGIGRFRREMRLFTKATGPRSRKTSWTHVLNFIGSLQLFMGTLPNVLEATIEVDLPESLMPWAFIDEFGGGHDTKVFTRKGAAKATFHSDHGLPVFNEVSRFSRMLARNKETIEAPLVENVHDFMIFGEPHAVRKFTKFMTYLNRAKVVNTRALSEAAIGLGAKYFTQHNLLVLIRVGDQWKPVPMTSNVLNHIGVVTEIISGEGAKYGLGHIRYDHHPIH